LAYLAEIGRIDFRSIRDNEVLDALKFFAQTEGVIAALESSHALAAAMKLAKEIGKGKTIVVNVSGRGDKDIFITAGAMKDPNWIEFLKTESKRYE